MENKIPLILILSFLTLVIVGGIFYFQNKGAMNAPFNVGQKPKPLVIPQPVTRPQQNIELAGIKDISEADKDCAPENKTCKARLEEIKKFISAPLVDISDWLVYENKQEKFKFKYPKEWIKEIKIDHSKISIDFYAQDQYNFRRNPPEGATDGVIPILSLSLIKNSANNFIKESNQDLIALIGPYRFFLPDGEISIIEHYTGMIEFLEVLLAKNKFIYIFNFGDSKDYTILKTIINSLEFQK